MDKKKIFDEINKMNKENHENIFNIITKFNVSYTKNDNGIFINMLDINDNCLNELIKYINFINQNNDNLIEFKKKKEESKQLLFDTT